MDAAPITKEQLAQVAGQYFLYAETQDIPEKLWLDVYVAGNQCYLRAIFAERASYLSLARLSALAASVDELYGTQLVAVAYTSDMSWEEIEDNNRRLNRVL